MADLSELDNLLAELDHLDTPKSVPAPVKNTTIITNKPINSIPNNTTANNPKVVMNAIPATVTKGTLKPNTDWDELDALVAKFDVIPDTKESILSTNTVINYNSPITSNEVNKSSSIVRDNSPSNTKPPSVNLKTVVNTAPKISPSTVPKTAAPVDLNELVPIEDNRPKFNQTNPIPTQKFAPTPTSTPTPKSKSTINSSEISTPTSTQKSTSITKPLQPNLPSNDSKTSNYKTETNIPKAEPPKNETKTNFDVNSNRRSVVLVTASSVSLDLCGGCNEKVIGEHLMAVGKKWHPNHFNCCDCGILIKGDFYEFEKKPKCKNCFEAKCMCSKCNQPISGEFFSGSGKLFHASCVDRHKCWKCGLQIEATSRELSALEKYWHPECFVCTGCNCKLSGSFYNVRGLPHCDSCASSKTNNVNPCGNCGKIFTNGSFITYKDINYHSGCFVCQSCKEKLDYSLFYDLNGKPTCKTCTSK